MHKKIKAELVSLAHSILQLENSDDISAGLKDIFS